MNVSWLSGPQQKHVRVDNNSSVVLFSHDKRIFAMRKDAYHVKRVKSNLLEYIQIKIKHINRTIIHSLVYCVMMLFGDRRHTIV